METKARLAAGLLSLLIATPAVARADDKPAAKEPTREAIDEAGKHFRRGVELYKEGDFGGALAEFRRAQQTAPNWRVLYNLGQTYFELQAYPDALRAFEAYLAEGGRQVPRDRRTAVEADIQKLKNRVALVEITADVEGAEVAVDGEIVGTTPLREPVLVSAGRRKITATAPGRVAATKQVEVVGAERATVALSLPETPVAALPSVTATPQPLAVMTTAPAPERSLTPVWIAWGVTGALAAATVTTGALALGAKSDFDGAVGTVPGDAAAIEGAQDRMRAFGVATDVLLVSTLVGAGVATYFTVRAMADGPKAAVGGRRGPSLGVSLGPGFALATGAF